MTQKPKLRAYLDPDDAGNSAAHHTGKPCIEQGCSRPAGTRWSPLWCFECNVMRMNRIDRHMSAMSAQNGGKSLLETLRQMRAIARPASTVVVEDICGEEEPAEYKPRHVYLKSRKAE